MVEDRFEDATMLEELLDGIVIDLLKDAVLWRDVAIVVNEGIVLLHHKDNEINMTERRE